MKEKIKYRISKNISREDIIKLYEDAGWTSYTNDIPKLMKAIENSLFTAAAFLEEELIGLIRIVGDGLTIIYIQDILVLNKYKRMKIGTQLMNIALQEFKDVRQKVLLTEDTEVNRKFYESFGFSSCDNGSAVAYAIQG